MERETSLSDDGVFEFNLEKTFAITTGKVLGSHTFKRDSVIQRLPCFLNSARFEIGMSGGPVFNSDGYVCGVVSSGISPEAGKEKVYTEYAGLLWPILGSSISLRLDSGTEREITIYEHEKNGGLHFDESLKYFQWDFPDGKVT